jgi:tRNA pseudouridine13 synthase
LPLPGGEYVPAPTLQEYLVGQRVEQGARAFRVIPEALRCEADGSDLLLSFTLPKGAYATALLRELLQLKQPA